RENVETFAEQGLISKQLATIQLDVPIQLDEEALSLGEPSKEVLEPLFAELEFRTLGKRVFGDEFSIAVASSASGKQMDRFVNAAAEVVSNPEVAGEYVPRVVFRNIDNTPLEYILFDTREEQQALAALLAAQPSFSFDTETTGT